MGVVFVCMDDETPIRELSLSKDVDETGIRSGKGSGLFSRLLLEGDI